MNVLQVFFTGFTPPSNVIYFCIYLESLPRPFQVALEGGKVSKDLERCKKLECSS